MNAMTGTAAPALPPYRADQRVTQPRVVRSEWTKLRSLPSAGWSLLATAVIIVGFGVLYTLVRAARPPHGASAVAAFDPAAVSLSGVQLAQLAIGVLGVLMITGEYATGLVNATLAAVPRRVPVLCGKAIVLVAAGLAVCVPATFAAFVGGQQILSPHHLGTTLGQPGTVRAVLGSALYLTVIGLLGLGLGALARRTAGAISALFGVLFALPLLASFLPGGLSDQVSKYLPGPAGITIASVQPDPAALGPWAGFGLLCLYTAIALGLAAWLLRRRDA
jgi:ABC-type transport system involved in multi-copper enzyme maturation permease subunit